MSHAGIPEDPVSSLATRSRVVVVVWGGAVVVVLGVVVVGVAVVVVVGAVVGVAKARVVVVVGAAVVGVANPPPWVTEKGFQQITGLSGGPGPTVTRS